MKFAARVAFVSCKGRSGGTRGALRAGVNEFLLRLSATGRDYADDSRALISGPVSYRALSASSRDEYERVLNWDARGRAMRDVKGRIVGREAGPRI